MVTLKLLSITSSITFIEVALAATLTLNSSEKPREDRLSPLTLR